MSDLTNDEMLRRLAFIKPLVKDIEDWAKSQGIELENKDSDLNTALANLDALTDIDDRHVEMYWLTDEEYEQKMGTSIKKVRP